MKERYGVVNDAERIEFEKEFQMPFGYELVTFNYREAETLCKKQGKGFVVDRITDISDGEYERETIYESS